MLRPLLVILFVIVLVFSLALGWRNSEPIVLDYLIGTVTLPASYVLLGTLFVGWLVGLLSTLGIILRYKREMRRLKREVQAVEAERNNLRNLPIRNDR